ncbi:hypothetical protein MCO_00697 [Bartonella sp. DB5-6]|nr:hypothetical protein MCO_00697 [Bartonella sp. DB5-6]
MMDILYQIKESLFSIIIYIFLGIPIFRKMSGLNWKEAVKATLCTSILFFISDFLRRYFGLF